MSAPQLSRWAEWEYRKSEETSPAKTHGTARAGKIMNQKSLPPLALRLFIVFGLCCYAMQQTPVTAAPAQALVVTDAERAEYQDWVQPYISKIGSMSVSVKNGRKALPVKLVLTAIEGDEVTAQAQDRLFSDKQSAYGVRVSKSGIVGYFFYDAMGRKGGGYPQLPAGDFARIEQLLTQLPDDGAKLPPAGRRLMVQFADGEAARVRVYDRANAPQQVLELLRLTGSGIRSWTPKFEPVKQWKSGELRLDSASNGTPDGQFFVTASSYDVLQFWDGKTLELSRAVPLKNTAASELVFSPDGSLAALLTGWGWGEVQVFETKSWSQIYQFVEPTIGKRTARLSRPLFSPDGRLLLIQSERPALRILDARSGKLLEKSPPIPPGVVAYVAAPVTPKAITLTPNNTLALWDSQAQRQIALLDKDVHLARVAFSPDGSQVAVATSHQKDGYWSLYRIRIWNANSGALVHELRPFEQNVCEAVEGLLWSRDGRYVLAATKSDRFFTSRGIDVWNAGSGRHRGEFNGPATRVNGLVTLGDGKLIAGCDDGIVRVWDAAQAFQEIQAFETSLGAN